MGSLEDHHFGLSASPEHAIGHKARPMFVQVFWQFSELGASLHRGLALSPIGASEGFQLPLGMLCANCFITDLKPILICFQRTFCPSH